MSGASQPKPGTQAAWEGKYIKVLTHGTWEYVSRTRNVSAAVILAADQGHIILVEQYRIPLGARCLELPAGLVGDEEAGEDVIQAAMRELEEETGYRAERMVDLGRFHASPGMSSEGFSLLRAEGLTRVGEGGGVEGEQIAVHRVPIGEIREFIDRKRSQDVRIDVKLLLLLGASLLEQDTE
jgi:ADP-ribose pyrophosphatase